MNFSDNERNLDTPDSVEKIINALDLSKVIDYLVCEKKWPKSRAMRGCSQYKNYLLLLSKYPHPESIPPSLDIDVIWRTHIIHAEDYNSFSKQAFHGKLTYKIFYRKNRFINAAAHRNFENTTKRLYLLEYNEALGPVRKKSFVHLIGWFKMNVRWFVAAIISGFLVGVITDAKINKTANYLTHSELMDSVRDLSYDDERTYLICKDKKARNFGEFYYKSLLDINNRRRKHFFRLLNNAEKAYDTRLITESAYKAIFSFNKWNNRLYLAGLSVCNLKLKNMEEIKAIRENLGDHLLKSRRKKTTFLQRFL